MPARPCGSGLVAANADQQLADVLALEELEQRLGKALEAVDDVFAALQLPLRHPACHLACSERIAIRVSEDHHAGHARAVDEQRELIRRPLDRRRIVVLRDRTADRDSRAAPDAREHGIEDVAADVVEIDVDTLRAVLPQALLYVA